MKNEEARVSGWASFFPIGGVGSSRTCWNPPSLIGLGGLRIQIWTVRGRPIWLFLPEVTRTNGPKIGLSDEPLSVSEVGFKELVAEGMETMKKQTILVALVVLMGVSLVSQAEPGRLAIAGRSGTLGLGGELVVNVLPNANVRLGAGYMNLGINGEMADIDYDFSLDLLTFPITIDWYPFKNSFHISGGIVLNQTEVGLDGRYSGTLQIGDTTYTAGEIGTLSGDITFDKVAPYIGIGWGNAFGKSGRWGLIGDLGVAYTGSPNVALSATGTLASDPTFQGNLAREEADIQDDVDGYKFYPVLSTSLYFRF